MTEFQRFEETCVKCSGSKKCFANALNNPDNAMRCANYGIFKKEVTDNAK